MVTAITQSKDLKIIEMDELIGTLRAHEILLDEDKPIMKGKMIAFKTSEVHKVITDEFEFMKNPKDQQLVTKMMRMR